MGSKLLYSLRLSPDIEKIKFLICHSDLYFQKQVFECFNYFPLIKETVIHCVLLSLVDQ